MIDWLLTPIDAARHHGVGTALAWHGRLMVLAWAVLAPLAVLVARYGKVWPGQDWPRVLDNPAWWRCHWIGHGLVVCLSLTGLALGLAAGGGSSLHGATGLALLGLMALQVGLGLMRGTKGGPTQPRLRGDHYDMTPRRVVFEWLHKTLGYGALLLGTLVLVMGLWQTNAPRWMWLALAVWGLGLGAIAVHLQRRGMALDTYQAIWGPDRSHPGNRRPPIGWGIRRHHVKGTDPCTE